MSRQDDQRYSYTQSKPSPTSMYPYVPPLIYQVGQRPTMEVAGSPFGMRHAPFASHSSYHSSQVPHHYFFQLNRSSAFSVGRDDIPSYDQERRSFNVAPSFEDYESESSSPLSHQGEEELVSNDQITDNDILCGRGCGTQVHQGNVKFRTLIADYQYEYVAAKPLDKANIAKSIVSKIIGEGGRFLRRSNPDSPDGPWLTISFKAAREKTCQALRERAPTKFDVARKPSGNIVQTAASEGRRVARGDGIAVNDRDVLFGRGGVTNSHLGNRTYRNLVSKIQPRYLAAAKLDKAAVAMTVVEEIYKGGGRFLMDVGGVWVEVSKEKAREKTSQALRERAAQMRKVYGITSARKKDSKRRARLSAKLRAKGEKKMAQKKSGSFA